MGEICLFLWSVSACFYFYFYFLLCHYSLLGLRLYSQLCLNGSWNSSVDQSVFSMRAVPRLEILGLLGFRSQSKCLCVKGLRGRVPRRRRKRRFQILLLICRWRKARALGKTAAILEMYGNAEWEKGITILRRAQSDMRWDSRKEKEARRIRRPITAFFQ